MNISKRKNGRTLFRALLAAMTLAMTPPLRASRLPDAPAVRVSAGTLNGVMVNDNIHAYLGIPYAAAPVGPLRWRAPRPAVPWQQPRDASRLAAACPQPDDRFTGLTPKVQDEDCLYLNVWVPAGIGKPLPVMVWLHGGAHRFGAGSVPFYDGRHLARRGVLVVTLNYRLGYLGYFSHPALDAEDEGGNFGLMDQKAALQWVQDNIASFGGDPKQVTLFGESAGGADTLYLMADQKARGLFQRAIVQSGGGWNRPLPKPKMQAAVLAALEKSGVNPKASAAELRQLDTGLLVKSLSGGIGFGAFLDGKVTFEAPSKAFDEGRSAKIPLIIGSNDWESNLLLARSGKKSLLSRMTPYLPQVYRWYGDRTANAQERESLLFRDVVFAAPARWLAARQSRHSPAWLYRFGYVTSGSRGKVPGAGHAAEIAYVFDTLGATEKSAANSSSEDHALASRMSDCWVAFARTGAPDCALSTWQPYSPDADNALLIDRKPQQIRLPDRDALDGVTEWFGPGTLLGG